MACRVRLRSYPHNQSYLYLTLLLVKSWCLLHYSSLFIIHLVFALIFIITHSITSLMLHLSSLNPISITSRLYLQFPNCPSCTSWPLQSWLYTLQIFVTISSQDTHTFHSEYSQLLLDSHQMPIITPFITGPSNPIQILSINLTITHSLAHPLRHVIIL
jgi:hypothetical protein